MIAFWLLHPLSGNGASFYGGIFGDATIFTAFLGSGLAWYHSHNCHEYHCWRIAWHVHPDHGHPVCKKHHPHGNKPLPTTPENA